MKKSISVLVLLVLVLAGAFSESGRYITLYDGSNDTDGRITILSVTETLTGIDVTYRVSNIGVHMGNYTFTIVLSRPGATIARRTTWVEQEFIVSNGEKTLSFIVPGSSNIDSATVSVHSD